MDGPLPPPTADAKRKADESAKDDSDGNDEADSPIGKDDSYFHVLLGASRLIHCHLRHSYMDVLQELCQSGYPACLYQRKHMEVLLWKVP
jgi:hypothetical protein